MIPDMTIAQLKAEADERWGEIWDERATRMLILLMCPRKERKLMELHGDMVEHGQPVATIFHRPRTEAPLLTQQGFDPRDASFQFVDIATADLGIWMQQLVTQEGWLRGSVDICSVPFSVGIPTQRQFETIKTLCFRHPTLPELPKYFLPFPPYDLPGKCFVSLPRKAAAEMARQQAEVLGVGRLEKKVQPEPPRQSAPTPEAVTEPVVEPSPIDDPEVNSVNGEITEAVVRADSNEQVSVPLPPTNRITEAPTPTVEDVVAQELDQMPSSTSGADVEASDVPHVVLPLEESATPTNNPTPSSEDLVAPAESEIQGEAESEMSDLERELRSFFAELIEQGVEPSEFMNDPRWEDLSERSIAAGLESWPILLEMTQFNEEV